MSRLRDWAPAVVTAAALFGFPWTVALAFGRGGAWLLLFAADLLVLAAVAVFIWSPLVVLAAAAVSTVFFAFAALGASFANTCGTSGAADALESAGGAVLAVGIIAWGVRRGPRVLWVIPVGWIVYALWVVVAAHVIPGGAGGCFE